MFTKYNLKIYRDCYDSESKIRNEILNVLRIVMFSFDTIKSSSYDLKSFLKNIRRTNKQLMFS